MIIHQTTTQVQSHLKKFHRQNPQILTLIRKCHLHKRYIQFHPLREINGILMWNKFIDFQRITNWIFGMCLIHWHNWSYMSFIFVWVFGQFCENFDQRQIYKTIFLIQILLPIHFSRIMFEKYWRQLTSNQMQRHILHIFLCIQVKTAILNFSFLNSWFLILNS